MKIEDVKVGGRVRIREWDDMERERGLNEYGGISGIFGFSTPTHGLCGKLCTVSSIYHETGRISLEESDFSFSIEMLEPVTEYFTMPPPPDLGELHGVKLPAWFWDSFRKRIGYVAFCGRDSTFITYIQEGIVHHSKSEYIEPYTGQDPPPKPQVDELKRMARLV